MNLLGSRYETEESQIKTEPDSSPRNDENIRNDEMGQEDFDYDDEFDMGKDRILSFFIYLWHKK